MDFSVAVKRSRVKRVMKAASEDSQQRLNVSVFYVQEGARYRLMPEIKCDTSAVRKITVAAITALKWFVC